MQDHTQPQDMAQEEVRRGLRPDDVVVDPVLVTTGLGGESGASAKRNWWAAAREVVRVTKGKGVFVSGGSMNQADMRAPRDIANL